MSILDVVPRNRITTLVVQSCTLDMPWDPLQDLAPRKALVPPFWPALKRVSFTESCSTCVKLQPRITLLPLFFSQPIQHFELAAGSEPDPEIVRDYYWLECRHRILELLHEYSQSSLKMFWEKDEVSTTYVPRDLLKELQLSAHIKIAFSRLGLLFA
jgi:hypothetical protein